jgi:hypothetical protein
MVLPILLGIIFLLLLFALAVALLIYVPMLPLFVATWFVELFGDIHAQSALPILFAILIGSLFIWSVHQRNMFPTANGFAIILFGFLVIMFGASLFGDVWEILQAEQRYAAQEAGYFSSSLCKDHPTACLIKDDPHYSGQIVPGIVAEVVWYLGLAIAYYGFQESYWKDITEIQTIDYIVSLR